jgi:hypothetical protein
MPASVRQRRHRDREHVQERHRAVETARDPHEGRDDQRVTDELHVDERGGALEPPVEKRVQQDHAVDHGRQEEQRLQRLPRLQRQLDGERRDQQGGDGDDPEDHQPAELSFEFGWIHRGAGGSPLSGPPPFPKERPSRSC